MRFVNDSLEIAIITILSDANCLIDLPLDSLVLSPCLHHVPVCRLIGLVSYLLGPLMRFSVVVRVQDICIIDWKFPGLLLIRFTFLVLIEFDLVPHSRELFHVHLSVGHESAYTSIDLHLLQLLWRYVFILLLNLCLDISRECLHVLIQLILARLIVIVTSLVAEDSI